MHSLNMECDARMRNAQEIREDMEKGFNNRAKSVERQNRRDLMETESQSRSRQLQELQMTLSRQLTEKAELRGMHTELRGSYQELVNEHNTLQSSFNNLSATYSD